MNRRGFLTMVAEAGVSLSGQGSRDDNRGDRIDLGDHTPMRVLRQVDSIRIEGSDKPRHVGLVFVNFQTTPEGDVILQVPCHHPEPAIHVSGSVPHEVSFWMPGGNPGGAVLTFEYQATISVYRQGARGQEIVLVSSVEA